MRVSSHGWNVDRKDSIGQGRRCGHEARGAAGREAQGHFGLWYRHLSQHEWSFRRDDSVSGGRKLCRLWNCTIDFFHPESFVKSFIIMVVKFTWMERI